jgi:hypothetical protein
MIGKFVFQEHWEHELLVGVACHEVVRVQDVCFCVFVQVEEQSSDCKIS